MKYIDAELIKSTKSLYNDIDSCIGELIKARFDHNQENEGKVLFRMEGLMVATLQQLDCIIDSLQEEQDVNLDADIEMEWDSFNKHLVKYGEESEEVVWLNWNSFNELARHFLNLVKIQ